MDKHELILLTLLSFRDMAHKRKSAVKSPYLSAAELDDLNRDGTKKEVMPL